MYALLATATAFRPDFSKNNLQWVNGIAYFMTVSTEFDFHLLVLQE
jgi:hypothetical protein